MNSASRSETTPETNAPMTTPSTSNTSHALSGLVPAGVCAVERVPARVGGADDFDSGRERAPVGTARAQAAAGQEDRQEQQQPQQQPRQVGIHVVGRIVIPLLTRHVCRSLRARRDGLPSVRRGLHVVQFLVAGDHRLQVRRERRARGDQVDVRDDEGDEEEGAGGVHHGDRLQAAHARAPRCRSAAGSGRTCRAVPVTTITGMTSSFSGR